MKKFILRIMFKSGAMYDYPVEVKEDEKMEKYIDNILMILGFNSEDRSLNIVNKNDESCIKSSEVASYIILKNVNA